MPGGGNVVKGGVRETDDGSGDFLLRNAAGSSSVHRVWGRDGARVAGRPHADAAWEGSRWETALGNYGPGGKPHTYRMDFPTAGGPRNCPIEGCLEQAATRTTMRVHFLHRHVRDFVIILEEGNLPHPRFPHCNMLLPWRALNGRHLATA